MVLARVQFTLRCTLVKDPSKDTVCILGSCAELGEWDHERAVPLQCTKEEDGQSDGDKHHSETLWVCSVDFGHHFAFEYKYILKRANHVSQWETIMGNRTFTPGMRNAALEKPSQQISTFVASKESERSGPRGPRDSNLGNNGITCGYHSWECCQTKKEKEPWWQVDLEEVLPISSVVLWNRQGSTVRPISPVWLMVSNEPFDKCSSLEQSKSIALACQRFDQNSRAMQWLFEYSKEVSGRYVRVQLEGEAKSLYFAELEVHCLLDRSTPTSLDDNAPNCHPQSEILHEVDDGMFGIPLAHEAANECKLQVDDGWLTPQSKSELRIVLGSFHEQDSIHLFQSRPISVQLRVERSQYIHVPSVTPAPAGLFVTDASSMKTEDETDCDLDQVQSPSRDMLCVEYHRPITKKQSSPSSRRTNRLQSVSEEDMENEVDIEKWNSMADSHGVTSSEQRLETLDVLSIESFKKVGMFRKLDDSLLEELRGRMEYHEFEEGCSVITAGERRRRVFVVVSGAVQTVGQSTILGQRSISTKKAGSWFGEMAMLGGGIRSFTVCTTEKTSCYSLSREAFVAVIGKSAHKKLREQMVRDTTSIATVSHIVKWHEHSKGTSSDQCCAEVSSDLSHRQRDEFGKEDIQVFRISTDALKHMSTRFMIDVFATDGEKELLGTVYLLPSQFQMSNGSITSAIISQRSRAGENPIVGQCLLRYMLINPFVHPKNNLSEVWRNYWRQRPTLDVGHRGLGKSYHPSQGFRKANIRENTLVSFKLAGQLGADFIEFDVQLTKDHIPLVYHDFYAEVRLHDHSGKGKGEFQTTGIHELTLRQIDRCHISPMRKHTFKLQQLIQKHWSDILRIARSGRTGLVVNFPPDAVGVNVVNGTEINREQEHRRQCSTRFMHLINTFPTLKNVLQDCPENLGLNLEVKYPCEIVDKELRGLKAFDMNDFVDRILDCVFTYARSQRIVFSCFDPDVCVMLRAKQPKYPVFFLTSGGTDTAFDDTRCVSLPQALMFAKMERIQGIVTDCRPLLENPEIIPEIKREGIVLFSYGSSNTDYRNVQIQKMFGVDAVISDNVGDLTRIDGKKARDI